MNVQTEGKNHGKTIVSLNHYTQSTAEGSPHPVRPFPNLISMGVMKYMPPVLGKDQSIDDCMECIEEEAVPN